MWEGKYLRYELRVQNAWKRHTGEKGIKDARARAKEAQMHRESLIKSDKDIKPQKRAGERDRGEGNQETRITRKVTCR